MYLSDWPTFNPARLIMPGRQQGPLPFPLNAPHRTFGYVARNVIYHLFRSLRLGPGDVVLMPDYHSGVEVWAVRAAGATVRFYPINRRFEPDLDQLRALCAAGGARVLYAIHFAGWPQPLDALRALCREYDMILLEDCALALLSEPGGVPLGSTGDYAVYCLYKTLSLPHGGLLVQNRRVIDRLDKLSLSPCSSSSLAGRTAQMTVEWIRSRSDRTGKALGAVKRGIGRAMTAAGVSRAPVGDISPDFSSSGFALDAMDRGMAPWCHRLMAGIDYDDLRRKRRSNFVHLRDRLAGRMSFVRGDLDEGVCPLFFPLLAADKPRVTRALVNRGIGAVGFWNYGHPAADAFATADTTFLRQHVIELPIHQDISERQLDYMADELLKLRLRPLPGLPSGGGDA